MDYESMKFILETRMHIAKTTGNSAEQSLMTALLSMAEENKDMSEEIKLLKSKLAQGDE